LTRIKNYTDTFKKHFLNFRGRRLGKKYMVIESDDWGSERIPSKEALKRLVSDSISLFNNPFNYLDSLETENDLSALFEILTGYKDRNGNHPVITANTITANPDFGKISASGFKDYYYESTLKTYRNKHGCENSYSLIRDGIAKGIYHPQFHGREHLNVNQWLTSLQSGNEIVTRAFKAGIYGIDLDTNLTRRENFMAAFDIGSDREFDEHRVIIKEGTTLFRNTFGYNSKSFIAPCYIWHPSLETSLKENGVDYVQGLPIQYAPEIGRDYRKIYHYQGEKGKTGMVYFVRNCFFEPSLDNKFNWIEECLRRIKIIFFWGKPAVLGTHRINFMGSLNEENRKANLRLFSELIKMILKNWPDVEFTTTDKLGELY
jgi:hypothetical protein